MVDRDIQATANATKISYDQAYAQVLVHELGHYVYDGGDTWSYQLLNNATEFKQWFYYREGEASIFGTGIASEVRDNGGAFRVAGTSAINDLYTKWNLL